MFRSVSVVIALGYTMARTVLVEVNWPVHSGEPAQPVHIKNTCARTRTKLYRIGERQ